MAEDYASQAMRAVNRLKFRVRVASRNPEGVPADWKAVLALLDQAQAAFPSTAPLPKQTPKRELVHRLGKAIARSLEEDGYVSPASLFYETGINNETCQVYLINRWKNGKLHRKKICTTWVYYEPRGTTDMSSIPDSENARRDRVADALLAEMADKKIAISAEQAKEFIRNHPEVVNSTPINLTPITKRLLSEGFIRSFKIRGLLWYIRVDDITPVFLSIFAPDELNDDGAWEGEE